MIIGNGLIGSAFKLRSLPDEGLIFASGVSNSKEVNEDLFQRELDLLLAVLNTQAHYLIRIAFQERLEASEKWFLRKLKSQMED